jgi:phosphatidylcholine synthase
MDLPSKHPPPDPQAETTVANTRPWASAFAVHVLTACGAAVCLLAMIAATSGQWSLMFAWLGVALIIDGFDGAFARYFRVKQLLPRWSGDTLDLVVDYLAYVFVPAYAIVMGGVLPELAAVPAGILILITSALYFADRRMKTPDNYFRGFPALWNIVAFYLFVLRPAPWLAALVVLAFCLLTFVPFPFVHPARVARLRWLNLAAVFVWSSFATATVAADMNPGIAVKLGLSLLAIYFVAAGLWRAPLEPGS